MLWIVWNIHLLAEYLAVSNIWFISKIDLPNMCFVIKFKSYCKYLFKNWNKNKNPKTPQKRHNKTPNYKWIKSMFCKVTDTNNMYGLSTR